MNSPLPGISSSSIARAIGILYWAVCSAFFVFLLLLILRSFTSTCSDDISFLYYLAWLMNEHNLAPYRELYDTSFPGTFMLHAAITALFGYSDTGFHAANLTFFIALAAITWQLLSAIHPRVAAAAIAGFGFYYFTSKTSMFLQRDYLALLPAVFALLLAHREWLSVRTRMIGIGFLFALSASIKPHFAIGLPIVLLLASRRNILACAMLSAAGFLTWMAVCAIWLWHLDALGSFIDMTINYLPLYMNLDKEQNASSYIERLPWIFNESFTSISTAMIFALIACGWAITTQKRWQQRTLVIALAILMPVYVIYVVIGGRGWDYHWMPFMYFAITNLALLGAPVNSSDWRFHLLSLIPLIFLCHGLLYLAMRTNAHTEILDWKNHKPIFTQKDAATIELQQWLQTHIKHDDHVQIMVTGTSGPIFSTLLNLGIQPAGKVQIHLLFYRFGQNDYIETLKLNYLEQLQNHKPRLILDNTQSMYKMPGKINPYSFERYKKFIAEHYVQVYNNGDVVIYENHF